MDHSPNVGSDLVRIHKVITRALAILLHAHHAGEDEIAFPFWRARFPSGAFDTLVEQHRRMIPFIDQVQGWAGQGAEAWQADAVNGLHRSLADLQSSWRAHIAREEATVGPENAVRYLSPEENTLLGRQLAEHGQAHSQPGELVMPFIVYNLAGVDREAFLGLLPPVLANQLIPFAWKPVWEPMKPFLLVD